MESWLESLKYVEEPTETVRDLKDCLNEILTAYKRHGNAKISYNNRTYYIQIVKGVVQVKYIANEIFNLNQSSKRMQYTYPNARRLLRIEHYLNNATGTDKNSMLTQLKKRRNHIYTRPVKSSLEIELTKINELIIKHASLSAE
jgi:hypothetical protein